MASELLHAFETARYKVLDPEIEIKIGELNDDLNKLLSENNVKNWAFITPFNPRSQVISDAENEYRFLHFKKKMRDLRTFEGTGGGEDENFPLEKSLLILGIDPARAGRIGRFYEQDAIVVGANDKPAEVMILNPKIS